MPSAKPYTMNRKTPAITIAALLTASSAMLSCTPRNQAETSPGENTDSVIWLLTGSYAPTDSNGVALYEFNLTDGSAKKLASLAGISNPSFLTYRPDLNLAYTVGEDNGRSSTVNVVKLKGGAEPSLTLVQTDTTGGGAPCHIALSPNCDFVLTANYMGGNVTSYALDPQGHLTGQPQIVEFPLADHPTTSGGEPRLHSINFTPDGAKMIAADLGTDRLHCFDLNAAGPGLPLLKEETAVRVPLKHGTGPRHMAFSHDGSHAWLLGEVSGEVCLLNIESGIPTPVEYALSDSVGAHGSGDIHLSPDGRFLYASNRLRADGISVFATDSISGHLVKTGYQNTGAHPRNFAISPDGRWMLVACRDTDQVEVYSIDPADGSLTPTGKTFGLPKPVCLLFIDPVNE